MFPCQIHKVLGAQTEILKIYTYKHIWSATASGGAVEGNEVQNSSGCPAHIADGRRPAELCWIWKSQSSWKESVLQDFGSPFPGVVGRPTPLCAPAVMWEQRSLPTALLRSLVFTFMMLSLLQTPQMLPLGAGDVSHCCTSAGLWIWTQLNEGNVQHMWWQEMSFKGQHPNQEISFRFSELPLAAPPVWPVRKNKERKKTPRESPLCTFKLCPGEKTKKRGNPSTLKCPWIENPHQPPGSNFISADPLCIPLHLEEVQKHNPK